MFKSTNKRSKILSFILATLLFFASFLLVFLFNDSSTHAANVNDEASEWRLRMNTTFDSYVVSSNERNTKLYLKNEEELRNDPLALNTLISLLTIENNDLDDFITISSEIAQVAQEENLSNIVLNSGERYSVEYLLYAVIFYDSSAAMTALAENLSSNAGEFVEMLNSRMRSLGMINSTAYLDDDRNAYVETNSLELNLLMRAVNNSTAYRGYFSSRDSLYIPSMGNAMSLRNRMSSTWSLFPFERNVLGATMAQNDEYVTTAYQISSDDFTIYIIQSYENTPEVEFNIADNTLRQAIIEADSISENIFSNYELINLVSSGDNFRTVIINENVDVDLVYLNNVTYLKPVQIENVNPVMTMQIDDNITLPILVGEKLGQINFQMPNGEIYVASLGSSSDIYSDNSRIENILSTIADNENIVNMILILLIIVLIFIVIEIIILIVRHFIIRRNTNIRT